jgi:hypothetical protein
MGMAADNIAYPEWTDSREKGGLDPLGMQNSSINLYQRLLPGISNVTLRIRYYGLYAWLAEVYARRLHSTDVLKWQQLIRRAEAVYALAAVEGKDDAGVAGSRWARRKLAATSGRISFSEHADPDGDNTPYLQQEWGAYGAAYGSQVFAIGVLAEAREHHIPVPSPGIGDDLAKAFSEALGDAAGHFYRAVERGNVTRSDLKQLAPALPSAIRRTGAERKLYETLLLARGHLQRPEDLARRDTLLLLLHSASHFGRTPEVDDVRWLLYAASSSDGRRFSLLDEGLQQQRLRWRIYHANDLLHFSYETLLKFVLDTLAGYPAGITLQSLIHECVAAISETADSWPTNWEAFCEETKPAGNAATRNKNGELYLSALGAKIAKPSTRCTPGCALAALRLLAIVEQRTSSDLDAIDRELGALDRGFFHSLVTETSFLASLKNIDLSSAIAKIVEGRIVDRHLWVAHRKFRYQGDYTFLIEADEGRVRLRETSGPVFTNPRLGPALTFLRDIHLISEKGLTSLGKKLVEAK